MARHIVWLSPIARLDLNEITEPLLSAVYARLRLLEEFPLMGVAIPGSMEGWRASIVGIFRIIYRVKNDRVEVGYIRHCKRQSTVE